MGSNEQRDDDGYDAIAVNQRPREPMFNLPRIVMLLIALCAVVHVVRVYFLTADQDFGLLVRTAFIPIRYSGRYTFDLYALTSPFTYAFLHGSILHLGINMVWLAAFGSPLANRLGSLRFLAFWAVTGLASVGLYYVLHRMDQAPLIGASGAISGMMGAAARFGFRIGRSAGRPSFDGPLLPFSLVFRSRAVMTFLTVWMIINLVTGLVGFAPGIDSRIAWEAHIGGFVAGFFGIGYFVKRRVTYPDTD